MYDTIRHTRLEFKALARYSTLWTPKFALLAQSGVVGCRPELELEPKPCGVSAAFKFDQEITAIAEDATV